MDDLRKIYNAEEENWGRFYSDPNNYFTKRMKFVRDLVQKILSFRGKALDIGCATGFLSRLLAELDFDVYGIDISERMISIARESMNVPHDHFLVCHGDEIPFESGSFQLVTAIGLFPYIKDYDLCIKEISRVLKENGFVVATCINRFSIKNLLHIIEVIKTFRLNPDWRKTVTNLIRTGVWSAGYVNYASSKQAYSPAAFDRLFSKNGFIFVDQLNLYAISRFGLDKEPLDRKRINSFFARHLCWHHIGIYQKLSFSG